MPLLALIMTSLISLATFSSASIGQETFQSDSSSFSSASSSSTFSPSSSSAALDQPVDELSGTSVFSNIDDFLPVEEAYKLIVDVTGPQQLRLYWQIEPGYYLYKHRFQWQAKEAGQELSLAASFSPAKPHEDEYFGKTEVYYYQADVDLDLPRTQQPIDLLITSQGCADSGLCYPPYKQQFRIDMAAGTAIEQAIDPTFTSQQNSAPETAVIIPPASLSTLLYMALLAFMGGSILNLMPCVFPVLSLKVLSFAQTDAHERHVHSWFYTAGVVLSFLLIAAILISLQAAGSAVGWGFQLQSPVFIALLAYLFVVMGLSLSGLVNIGGAWMGLGSELASRSGASGSFFTGVLATLVASPCTAPFMGTALGFAISQPPLAALTIFAALGAGMAAPMVALSYSATLRNWMPKPGAWMETFKQAIAFPLYATAIWLLWVAGRQTGTDGMAALLLGCLLLALGLWLWHISLWRKLLATLSIAAALGLLSSPLLTVKPIATSAAPGAAVNAYTPEKLESLRVSGRTVFINVTADWCITCLANERTTLSNAEVLQAFSDRGIAYLKADWTNHDPQIADLLKQHGRTGIPLYLLYPADSDKPVTILPQLLSPGIVLKYLEKL